MFVSYVFIILSIHDKQFYSNDMYIHNTDVKNNKYILHSLIMLAYILYSNYIWKKNIKANNLNAK